MKLICVALFCIGAVYGHPDGLTKEKCDNLGFTPQDKIQFLRSEVTTCLKRSSNVGNFYIRSGSLVTGFCDKLQSINYCLQEVTTYIYPCLDEKEIELVNSLDLSESFLKLACNNDISYSSRISKRAAEEVSNSIDKEGVQKSLSELQAVVQESCTNYSSDPLAYKKIEDSINGLDKCLDSNLQTLFGTGPAVKECHEISTIPHACITPILNNLKECLDDEEKYIADFVNDLIDSLINFVCQDDGSLIADFISEQTKDPCVEENIEDYVCENANFEFSSQENLSKEELCGSLDVIKTCTIGFFDVKCTNNTATIAFANGLLTAITEPCIPK